MTNNYGMTGDFKIIEDGTGVYHRYETTTVTGSEMIANLGEFYSNTEAMEKVRFAIFDFSYVTKFTLSQEELQQIVEMMVDASKIIVQSIIVIIVKTLEI